MDSSFIPVAVQNIWNAWNIRGFMILSLCLQLILSLAATFRKKTSNGFAIFVVWSAYFLADWAAIFAFGLISNAGCRNSNNNTEVAQDLMAFWAAFLLIHLGGPDTITAFSLEDNALWLRHLVGLVAQIFAFLYIFVKTLPHNGLLIPTILIFLSGMIKYGERTRALYLASLENLKKSIKKTTDEADSGDEILPAIRFQNIFKGLIVDIMPDLSEWKRSREYMQRQNDAYAVFVLISAELSLLYEVFYTKIMAANSGLGVSTRCIAYYGALAAFILFCLTEKDEFHGVDVAITYALLAGVFVLDVVSGLMVAKSDWNDTTDLKYFAMHVIGQGFFPFLVGLAVLRAMMLLVKYSAIKDLIVRNWQKKMGSFNLLSHCFKQCPPRKCRKPDFIWEKLAEMRHTSKEVFDLTLWKLVFEDVQRKAAHAINAEGMRKVYEARGDWALEESSYQELMSYINDFQYDKTLLVWHIATEICYNIEEDAGNAKEMMSCHNIEEDDDNARETKRFSKILSDYMMYLLVKQSKLMSAVAGIGHIRYEDTCVAARKFGAPTMVEFCKLILEEHANITEPTVEVKGCAHSVLNDSCRLVHLIREKTNRWEIILKVWMELLSYAAGHCKADSHARLLSEGGEFITFVWMLLAHYGVGAQFPKE